MCFPSLPKFPLPPSTERNLVQTARKRELRENFILTILAVTLLLSKTARFPEELVPSNAKTRKKFYFQTYLAVSLVLLRDASNLQRDFWRSYYPLSAPLGAQLPLNLWVYMFSDTDNSITFDLAHGNCHSFMKQAQHSTTALHM